MSRYVTLNNILNGDTLNNTLLREKRDSTTYVWFREIAMCVYRIEMSLDSSVFILELLVCHEKQTINKTINKTINIRLNTYLKKHTFLRDEKN